MSEPTLGARAPGCLSDLAIDALLAGEARPAAEEHLGTCAICAARRQVLADEQRDFLERARPDRFAAEVLARARRPTVARWPWRIAFGLPPLLAAAAVLLLWLTPVPPELGDREKGAPVALEIFVKEASGRTERFAAERRYVKGDTLQLVYSSLSTRARWLAVVDVEEGGQVAVLHRGQLPAGNRRALDRSWILDEGHGRERIYLVVTDAPVDEAALRAAAQKIDILHAERLPVAAVVQSSVLINR